MNPRTRRSLAILRRLPLALLSLTPFLVPGGCTYDRRGEEIANLPPHVRLTGGPRDGLRSTYNAHVYWTGWDDDGVIAHYEIAFDPPEVFSEEEIAAPETFPDITTRLIPGARGADDTVRVSRVVDGVPYSFDFIRTTETDRIFVLSAAEPDSFHLGSQFLADKTAHGLHTLYLRGADNEGAYSEVDRLAFTATTYAPRARIEFPNISGGRVLGTGGQVRIRFGGFDPDPPAGGGLPVGYYYKLVNVGTLSQDRNVYREFPPSLILYKDTPEIPWIYQSADTGEVRIFVEPGQYVFGLRAVDEAGAVEPFLDWTRKDGPGNAFRFTATENGGVPEITITEQTLGTFSFRSTFSPFGTVETPARAPLKFRWNASAESYGGRILSYSWGVDVPDVERDGPGSGWSPWGNTVTTPAPLIFPRPGNHTFYVRALDTGGHMTLASLNLEVFDTPMNREVLIVDDYRNTRYPFDREQDEFWWNILRDSGRIPPEHLVPGDMWYESGGERDTDYLFNKPPGLSQLGRFKTVIWAVHGDGWCGYTSYLQATAIGTALSSYLRLGGQLWVTGPMTLAASKRAELDCNDPEAPFHDPRAPILPTADASYPISFEPGNFAYDFFKINGAQVGNDKGDRWENSMVGVKAFDRDNPIFADMQVDGSKFNAVYWQVNALTHCEAILEPIYADGTGEFSGDLDSLYTYVAANEVRPLRRQDLAVSPYTGKICALRWHDPDPGREHGRVMWFGFSLYYMFYDQALDTFNRAFDWFREEARPVNPGAPGSAGRPTDQPR